MNDGWHLNKNLTTTHIFATLGVTFSLVVFGVQLAADVETSAVNITSNSESIGRVAVKQADSKANSAAIQRIENQQNIQYTEIIRRLERISDKLDTKADK